MVFLPLVHASRAHVLFLRFWRPGGSAGVSPHLRTWSLGFPISVPSSKFGLPVVLSKIALPSDSGLAKWVFGYSDISDLLRQSSHSRWCDRDYRLLDPTDRRIAVNRITVLFFENVVRGIRTLDLPSGGATTPPLY